FATCRRALPLSERARSRTNKPTPAGVHAAGAAKVEIGGEFAKAAEGLGSSVQTASPWLWLPSAPSQAMQAAKRKVVCRTVHYVGLSVGGYRAATLSFAPPSGLALRFPQVATAGDLAAARAAVDDFDRDSGHALSGGASEP